MMGQQASGQNSLFYEFCLEQNIPDNHLLRRIDSFLDFDELRFHLFPYYSLNGRPSIDLELMIRMLLIGYCMAFGLNAGFVNRSIIIWRIDGFAD
jgi:transposase